MLGPASHSSPTSPTPTSRPLSTPTTLQRIEGISSPMEPMHSPLRPNGIICDTGPISVIP
eukprot:scaffold27929_cov62-Phaeocystis_antarctica.AAC.3